MTAKQTQTQAISSAHDISAQCVAIVGRHAAYELTSADLTVASLADLTTYNLRRLFANVSLPPCAFSILSVPPLLPQAVAVAVA